MIELRYYQKEVMPAVVSYLKKNPDGHPLVALPTAAGKTYSIADVIKHYMGFHKVLVLSHVKEILEQNHSALSAYLEAEVGLFSAMLNSRTVKNVTVAGIQSVYRMGKIFADFDIVIIDEAHLISIERDTMYSKFFGEIGRHNRIGFTATPYRLGSGYIYGSKDNTPFTSLVCDWTKTDKFNRLIEDGYLCKLTTKHTKLEMDTTGIALKAGDFNDKQLSDAFDRESVTNEAIAEIIEAGKNRAKWLIFAIDIAHAEHIAEVLIRNGIPTAPVHSNMADSGFDRSKVIEDYKNGKYRCLVNVNILTTGFDYPAIDLIACLRPTHSPVLHIQSLGRGCRIHGDKSDCLVLDFAGNTERIGPINNPTIRVKGKGAEGGEPVTKTCPDCQSILPPAVKLCPDCGHEFKFLHGLSSTATNCEVIEDGKSHWIDVDSATYEVNSNFGSPSTVKVTYNCGGLKVNEYICVEHKGFAKHKADHWVKYRGGKPCDRASDLVNQSKELNIPKKILVQKRGRYSVVNDAVF